MTISSAERKAVALGVVRGCTWDLEPGGHCFLSSAPSTCFSVQVHRAVVASGVRFSGPTIHFVDEEYDTGALLRLWTVRLVAMNQKRLQE
jgi:hypothetical protein